jgi:Na+/phosphate symporter
VAAALYGITLQPFRIATDLRGTGRGCSLRKEMRRKEASRAEAIVKGIGGIVMVLVLALMTFAAPYILKGKTTDEMMRTVLHMLMGFFLLCASVSVIGLIVWFRVLKGKKKREDSSTLERY